MAVPLTLSTVPAQTPYVQYVATGGQTVFPYPFEITQDSDLICEVNSLPLGTDVGYSLSGQGNSTGGFLTFASGQTAGAIITLYRNISIARITQLANNGTFFASNFNNEFNRIYLILQQLQVSNSFALQVPNTNNPAPVTVLTPSAYANKYLSFDGFGNPQPAVLTSLGTLTQSIISGLLNPQTTLEQTKGVVPTNTLYPAGWFRRYGAVGDGITDDTVALTKAISCNDSVFGYPGDVYAVQTITFPLGGPHYYDSHGAWIRGISTTAQNCIVAWQMEGMTLIDYQVDGNFSQNYLCGTWWYNAVSSSQYNSVFGIKHTYLGGVQTASGTTVQTMIFGALIGQASTNFAQSENAVYGWRTRGCQNPFYMNHANGVIHFSNPIFVCVNEEWTGSVYNFALARAFQIVQGNFNMQGGEIQIASAGTTFAAEMAGGFVSNCIIEANVPVKITGAGPTLFSGGRFFQSGLQPCFKVAAGVTGVLTLTNFPMFRPAGVGAFDNNPLVDASAAAVTFETLLEGTQSNEYRWTQIGADVRLVSGGIARYRSHRMSMTAADSNVYILNTQPTDSILDVLGFDSLGYSTSGWTLTQDSGGGTTLTATTNTGPTGYSANQIQLLAPSGQQAIASFGNPTSLTTLKATAVPVRPGQLLWISAWLQYVTGGTGTGGRLSARFFTSAGVGVTTGSGGTGDVYVADNGSILTGTWKFVEGPIVVPAGAAYMCPGLFANTGQILCTDLRLRRAA